MYLICDIIELDIMWFLWYCISFNPNEGLKEQ